jgi:hypothetical protein
VRLPVQSKNLENVRLPFSPAIQRCLFELQRT